MTKRKLNKPEAADLRRLRHAIGKIDALLEAIGKLSTVHPQTIDCMRRDATHLRAAAENGLTDLGDIPGVRR